MSGHDPLDQEERALARLLGRPPGNGPSARVDDAILAAARAAVEPAAASPAAADPSVAPTPVPVSPTPRRQRPRWPVAMGLAATMVMAIGIGWHLQLERPSAPMIASDAQAPDAAPEVQLMRIPEASSKAAADAVAPPPPPAAMAPPPPPPVKNRTAPKPAPVIDVPEPRPSDIVTPMAPPAPASAQAMPPPPQAPIVSIPVDDAPAAKIVSPPAPPAPPAPASVAMEQADAAPAAAPAARRSAAPTPPLLARQQAREAASTMAAPDALQREVEADRQLSRRDWLKRIGERQDAGDIDGARASLRAYMAQYPEARIPRALRPLLDQ